VFSTIAQENTLNRLRCQLSAFTRSKKDIAKTPKKAKTGVIWWLATEALIWDSALKSR